MKKWFFSNNGDVTAPLDLDAAKEYLAENPNVYGWHPSFSQWKPVNCISDFVDVLPPTVQSPSIPKEISDKFLAKKQRLETKLTSIDDSVKHSQSSLGKLETLIANYQDMTQNLNDDVKGAIDNIERKYKSLSRKLSQVKDAVHIAENEMAEVVDDFDLRMSSNDIFMPSCNRASMDSSADNDNFDRAQTSKAKLAQEKLATPHKRVEPVKKVVTELPVAKKEPVAATSPKAAKKEKSGSKIDFQADESLEAKDSFNGMKNMMKSVFKGDNKVVKNGATEATEDSKKAEEKPLSMAERLKMAQHNQ